jgi:hypothetical protein
LVGNAFATANRFGLNSVPPSHLQGFDAHSLVLDVKGKGKFKETDFDAAFAQAASSIDTVSTKAKAQSSGTSDQVDELETDFSKAKLDDVNPDEGIYQAEFKRFVGQRAGYLATPNSMSLHEASGSRCKTPSSPLSLRKWQSGRQSSINL